MSIITSPMLLGADVGGPYQINRSLRFSSGDSSYLSRTPASAGNRKTWTWAGWVKRSTLGSSFQTLFGAGTGGNAEASIRFNSDDTIEFYDWTGGYNARLLTTQVFRDPSAWYHLVAVFDTPNATADNRIRLYVNGSEITTFGSRTNPTQNYDGYINNSISHTIGDAVSGASPRFFNGYLADVYLVDGQALDPSSFTETDATTGQLVPKAFSGSYGTNGGHWTFSDNSGTTSTTLGKDSAGSNNFTPNNFSVSSGAGNDSLVDVPTNGTASSGADPGGSTRGNYCTWNPTDTDGSVSYVNGNLEAAVTNGSTNSTYGTFSLTSGKWYWEIVISGGNGSSSMIGVAEANKGTARRWTGANGWYYYETGVLYNNLSSTSYGSSYTNGDVIGVALDMDNGNLVFYKNNTSQGTAYSSGTFSGKTIMPAVGNGGSATVTYTLNAGTRAFAYTAPSGFKALCTANLPAPLITKPSTVFDVKPYTGNGSTQTISGFGFGPDLVWIKRRDATNDHMLQDQVRGATAWLSSNRTDAENSNTSSDWFRAFTSDGFTVAYQTTGGTPTNEWNLNNATYAAWCWDAGTTTVTNTQGSITASLRANPTAGFAVITGSTPASNVNFTFGHNLSVAPSFVIYKHTAVGGNWQVYHRSGGGNNYNLNSTAGPANSGTWSGLDPTSTLITIPSTIISANSSAFVCYAFSPVVGYSSMGSYVGSSSYPFVYCGFKPRFLLVKPVDLASDWYIYDSARNTYNTMPNRLFPNSSSSELSSAGNDFDFLSNGFRVLGASNSGTNYSGITFIYYAVAESPFQYARAR